jgi:hypothetical protein
VAVTAFQTYPTDRRLFAKQDLKKQNKRFKTRVKAKLTKSKFSIHPIGYLFCVFISYGDYILSTAQCRKTVPGRRGTEVHGFSAHIGLMVNITDVLLQSRVN